jgi:DNA-binding FrmR family transcriptional regulator
MTEKKRAKPHGKTAPHDDAAKKDILARMRSAEGHLRSVALMVEEDAYCMDVLRQTSAVRAAIAKVEALLLERHLQHCVIDAVRSKDAKARERAIGEILEAFGAERRR